MYVIMCHFYSEYTVNVNYKKNHAFDRAHNGALCALNNQSMSSFAILYTRTFAFNGKPL